MKILKKTIQIKKCEILKVFNNMFVDMLSNKKYQPIVTELFIIHYFLFKARAS